MAAIESKPVGNTALRTTAFALLWFAIAAQAVWMCVRHVGHNEDFHQFWNATSYIFYFAVPYVLLALTGGRIRWIASLLRLPIAFAFLQAVADRLGLLGPAGAPGVAWGDFSHFIHYTALINPFLPVSIIPTIAVLATIAETTFGLSLLLGIRIPFTSLGTAALLLSFGIAMTVSGYSQFAYGVTLMAAGAFALSTVDASWLSIDSLVQSRASSAKSISKAGVFR